MKNTIKILYKFSVLAVIATACSAAKAASDPVIIVDNKTSKFNDVFVDIGAASSDSSSNELAETIRRQRALLDAQSNQNNASGGASGITTANACDSGLRTCMTEKCGQNFTKCTKDSTTVWNEKMESCRRKTKCTGHEYTLLAPELLADRDAYVKLSYYQSVVDCGNKYNNCVFQICGKTLDKCLSKSAGDSAISKCKSIADQCKEQDSGLAARVMGVFGDLRTIATANVQKDEKRLYELRDLMRTQCNRLGAMFDERTLDCVYTVNFFVGEDPEHPMASKKLYAGDSFKCNANWFGIDVTTFKENAYRLTRSQTSASAAALGSGLGTAAGLLSSNAIGRALDTQKAAKAAEEAQKLQQEQNNPSGLNNGNMDNDGVEIQADQQSINTQFIETETANQIQNSANNNGLTIDVTTKITSSGGNKIDATITCGTNIASSKQSRTITLKKIAKNTDCTITASGCDQLSITADNITSNTTLTCTQLDACIGSDGKWKNDTCDCNNKAKKWTGRTCLTMFDEERCQTDCEKFAKRFTKTKYRIGLSKMEKDICWDQCDKAVAAQCKALFMGHLKAQCDNTRGQCTYQCAPSILEKCIKKGQAYNSDTNSCYACEKDQIAIGGECQNRITIQ